MEQALIEGKTELDDHLFFSSQTKKQSSIINQILPHQPEEETAGDRTW